MPSEQARLPFWLCTCALLIFLVAAGFSPSLGAGSPANLDCGRDVNCFAKALDEHNPAAVRQVTSVGSPPTTGTSSSYWETRGFTGDKCILYFRLEAFKASVDRAALTKSVMAQMGLQPSAKAQEMTETAVKQMADQFEGFEHDAGLDGTCLFQTGKLKALIARWQKGEAIEGNDWTKQAESCQGPLWDKWGGDLSLIQLGSSPPEAAPPASPPAVPTPPLASERRDITSNTKVTPFYEDGTQFQFKPEEKRAFLFIWSINDLERTCIFHLQSRRACPLDELVKGFPVKGSPTPVGLSQDPRQEKDYEYVVTVSGLLANQWAVTATPRRSGLGGFFDDTHAPGFGAGLHFNPAGPATKNDKIIKGANMEGPTFLR